MCGLSGRILWFHCDWSFWLWCISSPENFMLRYMVHRGNNHYLCFTSINHDPHLCGATLYLHHQDYLEISFCSTEWGKSLFHLLLLHNCDFYHNGSCIFICIKFSAKEQVAINRGVSVLINSSTPVLILLLISQETSKWSKLLRIQSKEWNFYQNKRMKTLRNNIFPWLV